MSWTLFGKKALVTGGTKGIGLAIAQEFLDLEAEVLVVARETKSIQGKLRNSANLFTMDGDVTKPESRNLIIQKIGENWGKLDVLVNNVGTNFRKTFVEYTEQEYRSIFETNLFSLMELTRMAYPLLKKGVNSSVVNIASVAGSFDIESGPPYGMTKAALIQLTRNLAGEWASDGIRVNAVSPWYTRTPLASKALSEPERLKRILTRTPLNRIAEPEEVSGLVAFLAMDKASFITGQDFKVDGGMSVKGL